MRYQVHWVPLEVLIPYTVCLFAHVCAAKGAAPGIQGFGACLECTLLNQAMDEEVGKSQEFSGRIKRK